MEYSQETKESVKKLLSGIDIKADYNFRKINYLHRRCEMDGEGYLKRYLDDKYNKELTLIHFGIDGYLYGMHDREEFIIQDNAAIKDYIFSNYKGDNVRMEFEIDNHKIVLISYQVRWVRCI